MRKVRRYRYDRVLLWLILIVSAVLRLWQLGSVPFMHDEFSALGRTCFDNFHDLIREGVMLGDSHPAGTQVLLYILVKIFGWNAFWLKLPFALMGVASVYLVYVIANQWFNRNVGLVSAALVSVSELFLFYSQLARPYSPGLFFILLFVYYWNRILFDKREIGLITCFGFAVSAFLAAEMQMFSMAEAGLIALSGLLFLKKVDKNRRKAYLWSCVAAVVLYLPTLPIFYYQLFVYGSIGGWLAKPAPAFLTDFLKYSLNYSNLFIFTMLIVALLPLIVGSRKSDKKLAIRICCLVWFVLPLALAWAYSLLKEPILQYSTLIFSFPFLIILVFSYFNTRISVKTMAIVIGFVLLTGITSLVIDRQYFNQVYHQGFDQIAVEMRKAQENYGDSIAFVSYSDRTFTNEFYQNKAGIKNAKFYCEDDKIFDYQSFIINQDAEYLGVGLADHADMPWELSAVAEYPYLIQENTWFTTRYLTLGKTDNGHPLLHNLKENVRIDGKEWACTTKLSIGECVDADTERIGFIADIQAIDTVGNIALIVEIIDSATGEKSFWKSFELKDNVVVPGERLLLTNGFFLPAADLEGKMFKVYVWNKEKKELLINRLSYYLVKKNAYFYGLYNPL
ncbi:MAG: glycosyltransferase family 39 protein [Bacteroidales bacterium]|nr:glycosyltransferase family 39 protein [Bacteroidales bacterium]